MWIAFALVAAIGTAAHSFSLKLTAARGGVVVSTVAYRLVGGALLCGAVAATGGWPPLTPGFWRAMGMVLVPEVLGMVLMTLALRGGELSVIQPLSGLLPPLVMLGGFAFLGEVPTPYAAAGVAMVTLGIYCIGLRPGGTALHPLRSLAASRASWYAVGSFVAFSFATLVHKVGIAEVGPFQWGAALSLGSAAVLAAGLPWIAWRREAGVGLPARVMPWAWLVVLTGATFAVQVAGLQLAFRLAQAGYVMAVASTSILIATALGIGLLGERSAARTRAAGALLVTGGAALIALLG